MNKKVRWGIIGATSLLVIGIGLFTVNESNYSKKVEAVVSGQGENSQLVKEIKKQINALYFGDDKQFLNVEISQEKIDSLMEKVNKLSEVSQVFNKKIENLRKTDQKKYQFNVNNLSFLQDEVKMIQQKFNAQVAVNDLFQSSYLKEGTENKEVVIIDDLSTEKLNEVKKATLQKVDEKEDTKKFELAINHGIEIAQKQLAQIDKVKKMMNDLYKDGILTDKVTRENYESTKKEVEQIKNQKAKESFTDVLKTVEVKVQEDEAYKQKLEAEIQVEEAKRQAEIAKKQAQEVQSAPVTQSTETQPIVETPIVQPSTPATNITNDSSTTNNSRGNDSSNNTGDASTGSNSGGSSSGGSTGGSSGGNTNPTLPAPEKPYALNPYTGSGVMYLSYAAAASDGEKWMMESTNVTGGYKVYTEYWSDGTEKYYLELY